MFPADLSHSPDADYRVVVKVKNAKLLRVMERAGIKNNAELARLAGCQPCSVGEIANLTVSGMRKNNNWRKAVLDISTALRCMPEDIVPDAHLYQALEKNTMSFDTDLDAIQEYLNGSEVPSPEDALLRKHAILRALEYLTPREKEVVERVNGINRPGCEGLVEIGYSMGVGRTRPGQIYNKAIRKLKRILSDQKGACVLDSWK